MRDNDLLHRFQGTKYSHLPLAWIYGEPCSLGLLHALDEIVLANDIDAWYDTTEDIWYDAVRHSCGRNAKSIMRAFAL